LNLRSNSRNNLLIKQSYLMLTWFSYLKNQNNSSSDKVSFFVKPTKKTKYTLTKSPMAHKTFSQEQYVLKFFNLNVSFKVQSQAGANSVNKSLYVAHLIRNSFIFFETNLFFLQRAVVTLPAKDSPFFKLK